MANSYVYKYTPFFNSLKKNLQKLKCNKDIVITNPDKGNSVVILSRDDYIESMIEFISEKQKFKKLKKDHTLKRERVLQWTLREINKKNMFSDTDTDTDTNLYLKGSKPSRLNGTRKVHKIFLPGSLPLRLLKRSNR